MCNIAYLCQSVLYFRQGTFSIKAGINYRNVFALASDLGEAICEVLLSFHVLTGSDFTRFFSLLKIQSFKKCYRSHQQQN